MTLGEASVSEEREQDQEAAERLAMGQEEVRSGRNEQPVRCACDVRGTCQALSQQAEAAWKRREARDMARALMADKLTT